MPRIRQGKMTKPAMIRAVREATGLAERDARNAVEAVYQIMQHEVISGREVDVPHLGVIKTIWLKPRVSNVDFGSEGEAKKRGWRRKIVVRVARGRAADYRHEHFNDDPDYDPRVVPYEELPPKVEDQDVGQ